MGKYKVCNDCHLAFDSRMERCPSCGKRIKEKDESTVTEEGLGRKFGAGGSACDYCAYCFGSPDWCPILGD